MGGGDHRPCSANDGPTKRTVSARLWRRRVVGLALAAVGGPAIAALAFALYVDWRVDLLDPPPLANAERLSVVVLDRNDRLLRAFTTPGGRWRLPIAAGDVDQRYLRMLQAYEDRRFGSHGGVDWIAVVRSAFLAVRYGRFVSGASTLTMQVARLLDRRHERTLAGKWRQMLRAIQLERMFSKREILEIYLRIAPFGGNLEGVRAASLAYFGKEPRRLSIGEAALLVALPQAPESRRPDRRSDMARRGRDKVLRRMVRAEVISQTDAERATTEPVPDRRQPFPMIAAHLSDRLRTAHPERAVHRTTLERDTQLRMEAVARIHAETHGPRTSAAVVALDHGTGEVLAHVGSTGLLDQYRFGAIDMTRGIRSPGSALKPLIYGLAFDAGVAHPATLIEDRPVSYSGYRPTNFDSGWSGTVSVREALQRSLNVPAVKLLHAVGPARMMARLRAAGIAPQVPTGGTPSLALALGGLGLSLEDLAQLYAGIARGGRPVSLAVTREATESPSGIAREGTNASTILSRRAAWQVSSILSGAPRPTNTSEQRIAYKTGTSYGFRDAWAAGFDGQHTVVAWVGRPDDVPTPGLTGIGAAAPLLFDAFQRIGGRRTDLPASPRGVLHARNDALPPPLKRFRGDQQRRTDEAFSSEALSLVFPPDRADVDVAGAGGAGILLRAKGGRLPFTWFADGAPLATTTFRREFLWQPRGSGFTRLLVVDADGQTQQASVRLRR